MNTPGSLSRADPTDLDSLREVLAASDPDGKLNPIGMSRIEIGPEALDVLTETVSELTRSERVVLVADATPAYRDGEDLKERVARTLSKSFELERAVIGADRDELHADEEAVAEVEKVIEGPGCVVSVGSGTITDLCKMASKNRDDVPFVAVQSAGSVAARPESGKSSVGEVRDGKDNEEGELWRPKPKRSRSSPTRTATSLTPTGRR